MTNSEIEPFLSYSPSQRTNIYNIILINYRWDGELMLGLSKKDCGEAFSKLRGCDSIES